MNDIDDDYGLVVHSVRRNAKQEIRFVLRDYEGRRLIDIRVYFLKDGKYYPTKSGIAFSAARYEDLLQGVILLGEALGYELGA